MTKEDHDNEIKVASKTSKVVSGAFAKTTYKPKEKEKPRPKKKFKGF